MESSSRLRSWLMGQMVLGNRRIIHHNIKIDAMFLELNAWANNLIPVALLTTVEVGIDDDVTKAVLII